MVLEAIQTFVIAAKKGGQPRVIRKGYRPPKNDRVLKSHAQFFTEVGEAQTYSRAFTATAPPGEPQDKPGDE